MNKELEVLPKRIFSKIGFAMLMLVVVVQGIQGLESFAINQFKPELMKSPWIALIFVAVSFYMIAFPIYIVMMKRLPNYKPSQTTKASIKQMLVLFIISFAAMYVFNIISTLITLGIGAIKGSEVVNPFANVIRNSSTLATFLLAVICAPVIEEITFRGILIDKIRPYGDKACILISALCFALYHGNLSQLFYAFALGVVFAYVTLKFGTIKYSIILHMLINLYGSVIAPAIVAEKNMIYLGIMGIINIVLLIVGIVLFIKSKKNIVIDKGQIELDKNEELKIMLLNPGMLGYIILSIALIILVTLI
jgi:membrane protease YdiL (CAAX protease family)